MSTPGRPKCESLGAQRKGNPASRLWSDHVSGLLPYEPGEQPRQQNLLKLNTNEHPLGPSPRALQAIREATDDTLRLYPDYDSRQLCQAIAALHGIGADQVLVGNGSDEILAHVFHALFLHEGRELLMPDISYSFYHTYCRLYAVPHRLVPLSDDLRIVPQDYLASGGAAPAGIIFANPNAPTGIALPLEDISRIASAHPDTPVVVDEAYVDFGAQSAVALLATHPNIVVIHTMSKSRALAGLRVGYAMASPEIMKGLQRVKDSFNSYPLDRLAQAGALASVQDHDYFLQACRFVIDGRDALAEQLRGLGMDVLPSSTNFLFARHPQRDGAALAAALRERGILVRHFRNPRIAQYLRITVGTSDDHLRLIRALADVLAA